MRIGIAVEFLDGLFEYWLICIILTNRSSYGNYRWRGGCDDVEVVDGQESAERLRDVRRMEDKEMGFWESGR